jgi:hypothetical protein
MTAAPHSTAAREQRCAAGLDDRVGDRAEERDVTDEWTRPNLQFEIKWKFELDSFRFTTNLCSNVLRVLLGFMV